MTSTPRKRAAEPDWETPSTKALRASRLARPSTRREAKSRIGSQSPRAPLADIQQPRQQPAPPTPDAQQAKHSHEKSLCPIHQLSGEPQLRPTHSGSSSSIQTLAPTHPPHPSDYQGSHDPSPPAHAGLSYHFPLQGYWRETPYKPAVRHAPHPDSRLCQNFHWVPYPLDLLPYDSWFKLHHRPGYTKDKSALCPACLKERKVTPHTRKMFLIAERLSWEDGITLGLDKSLNEQLNWAVNYELGILDPFVEDLKHVPGGKNSQTNSFHPYANEYEMKLAFKYIFITDDITEITWALWIGMQLDLQKMLGGDELDRVSRKPKLNEDGLKILEKESIRPKTPEVETIDLTDSPPPKNKSTSGLPTPPLSFSNAGPSTQRPSNIAAQAPDTSSARSPGPPPYFDKHRRIVSYKTLQDFYNLLDKIERTSYVGALFLEAYAEKLRDDLCKECWLKRNVNLELY